MAQRRMFSPQIVESDAFLDMPLSSQALYFHLGMYADDDGFVSPRKIVRMLGTNEDDMKVLVGKRFLLPFQNGVVVIKHWRMNNLVRKDFYRPTQYEEEKSTLYIKDNSAYTLDPSCGVPVAETHRIQSVNEPLTNRSRRIGKDRIGKDTTTKAKPLEKFDPLGAEIIKAFEAVDPKNKTYYNNTSQRKACDFLLSEYGLDEVLKRVTVLARTNKLPYFPTITTPVQLRDKWVQLQDTVDRKKSELQTSKVKVI